MTKVKITAEQERLVNKAIEFNKGNISYACGFAVRYHIAKSYDTTGSPTQQATEALKDFSTTDILRIFLGEYEVDETALDILKRKYKKAKENTLHIESRRYVNGVEDTLEAFNLSLEEEN